MTDLREGRIQAFLDDEMEPDGRHAFIQEMARDQGLADAVASQRRRIEEVTAALDVAYQVPTRNVREELEEGWRAVMAGLEGSPRGADLPSRSVDDHPLQGAAADSEPEEKARPRRRMGIAVPLSKAAALLLVAAGVGAATVARSPLLGWLEGLYAPADEVVPALAPDGMVDEASAQVGVRLPLARGAIEVVLTDPLTDDLRVSVTDGESLEVMAGQGTRFSTSDGRIEASDIQGALTVRIPREQERVFIRVAGTLYLRKEGGRVEVLQSGADTLPSEFVFAPSRGERRR